MAHNLPMKWGEQQIRIERVANAWEILMVSMVGLRKTKQGLWGLCALLHDDWVISLVQQKSSIKFPEQVLWNAEVAKHDEVWTVTVQRDIHLSDLAPDAS
jgi:hypothetical protein